ncbi:MAG: tRNA 2-thiouridine(34) synthase MnmA [Vulcanimicrobiota bacterium]
MKAKIALAMSGGVDSSVAAYILKEHGFDLIGVTMVVSPTDSLTENPTIEDARRTCDALDIPHHTVDLRQEFQKEIIDYFAGEYFKGRTPNPCVMCNPTIKFGKLFEFANAHNCNKFATGHYARIELNHTTNKYELKTGLDKTKDQGYVLYRLTQNHLKNIFFPLGKMTKNEVKKIAGNLDYIPAGREESQEICFIEDDNYIRFLQEEYDYRPVPGPIIHINGEILGTHKGVIYYTIGQRRRLGIAHPKPLYVIKILPDTNTLVVGYNEDLMKTEVTVSKINWISGNFPNANKVFCKIRYRHKVSKAIIEETENGVTVVFRDHQRAITPGQSAVFYSYPDAEKILGGGIITRI